MLLEIEDGRTGGPERRALKRGREEAGRPVARAIFGQTQGIVKHDVSGKILIDGTEAVNGPRPECGITHEESAAVDFVQRIIVVGVIGPHGVDQADVVSHLRSVRQRVRHPHARLTVPREFVLPPHNHTDVARVGVADVFDVAGVRLAVVTIEHRFGIEEIHLTGAAVHEKLDDGVCFGRVVTWFWMEVKCRWGFWGGCFLGERRGGAEHVTRKQLRQRRAEEAVRCRGEEVAA